MKEWQECPWRRSCESAGSLLGAQRVHRIRLARAPGRATRSHRSTPLRVGGRVPSTAGKDLSRWPRNTANRCHGRWWGWQPGLRYLSSPVSSLPVHPVWQWCRHHGGRHLYNSTLDRRAIRYCCDQQSCYAIDRIQLETYFRILRHVNPGFRIYLGINCPGCR